MELQNGDWVRTEKDEIGKAVHISRLTVFIEFHIADKGPLIVSYLASDLTKIEPSEAPSSK
jgi:hypothetical protein